MFRIFINGKKFLLSQPCSISELLSFLVLEESLLLIEYNSLILPRVFWPTTYFSDFDTLEFVTVVGGG